MADYASNKRFFSASTLLMLAIAAWMSLSLVWHEPVPERWRVPLTCGLVLFSLCITSMRVLVTRKPDLPFAFVRAGGFVSSAFLALFWLTLLRDAFLVAVFLLGKTVPAPPSLKESASGLLLSIPFELSMFLGGFALAAAGMALALRPPVVREIAVPIRGLPHHLEGLRLVQISDLHIGASFGRAWLSRTVERVNALEADFIFITGDLADGSPERIGRHLAPLSDLKARYGVLAVPGNHDYYSGLGPWLEKWHDWGLSVLLNAHRDFSVNGCRVRVVGITDKCARHFPTFRHSPDMGPPDTLRALQTAARQSGSPGTENEGLPAAPADLTVLLAHRPGDAAENAALGVDLQLSGHTHGGQFFFLFPLVSHMNKGFRAGLYRVSGMPLHVSPGTGMWGYAPMRWGTRSEISLLVLERTEHIDLSP